MNKRIILFCIILLNCLWLSGCQAKTLSTPTPELTVAPTQSAIDATLDQIGQLETQKKFEDALRLLAGLQSDNPTYAQEQAGELDDRAAELHIAWGDDLLNQGQFLIALEKYELARSSSLSDAIQAEIEEKITAANQLLAVDSGEDGQKILEQTMAETCYQEVTPTNPVVGTTIPVGEPGRILVCDYSEAYKSVAGAPGLDPQLVQSMLAAQASPSWLPTDLAADTPGGVRFTLSRLDTYDTVTTCNYKNDQGLTDQIGVMRQESIVMIRDMFSGEILGEKTFNGADPNYHCPQTKTYDVNNFAFGQLVDNEKVIAWIRQILADYAD